MNYEPRLQNPPLPQAASTVFYTFGDDQEVLAAGVRPAPLSEVRMQDGVQRHLGISYELVQALDVPALQIGEEVDEVPMNASRNRLLQKFLRQQQVTVQEIPAVRHRYPGGERRVRQRTVEKIVNRPRVRISERVVKQTVDIPAPSSGRISERIVEQTVDIPRPRARISGANFGADRQCCSWVAWVKHSLRCSCRVSSCGVPR